MRAHGRGQVSRDYGAVCQGLGSLVGRVGRGEAGGEAIVGFAAVAMLPSPGPYGGSLLLDPGGRIALGPRSSGTHSPILMARATRG